MAGAAFGAFECYLKRFVAGDEGEPVPRSGGGVGVEIEEMHGEASPAKRADAGLAKGAFEVDRDAGGMALRRVMGKETKHVFAGRDVDPAIRGEAGHVGADGGGLLLQGYERDGLPEGQD